MSDFKNYLVPGKKGLLIGIGGVSMSPLAEVLHDAGLQIVGSDMHEGVNTQMLRKKNIEIHIGHRAENVTKDLDFIVRTAAVHDDNPEIRAARELDIPIFERTQAWGAIMRAYPNAICISGTHGKTTTTSMCTHIMMAAERDPTVMIGGTLPLLRAGHRVGGGDTIIFESCEYYNSFLALNPSIAVYKTQQIVNTFSGSKDPNDPWFYIADSADLPIKDAGIIQKTSKELEPGVSVWTPAENYKSYFEMIQNDPKNENYIWQFASAVESEEADRYKSIVGISGNYMEQSGTYDSAARSWEGSMTERYDFSKLTEDDYTASGRKDYLNSNNERVDTHWFMKHDTEIAD